MYMNDEVTSTCTMCVGGRMYVIVTNKYLWERVIEDLYKISRDETLAKKFRRETKKMKDPPPSFIFSFAWKHSPRGAMAKRANKQYRKLRVWNNWCKL